MRQSFKISPIFLIGCKSTPHPFSTPLENDRSSAGLMKGKRGLIMGVANQHSIAWGITKVLHDAGAELAFTYQGDLFKKRVLPLVQPLNPSAVVDCDVSNQGSIDAAFEELRAKWGTL